MAIYTFTTDHTTDQLTSTSHGLATGDGAVLVDGIDLPGGLSSGTHYWIIRTGPNTIRLATSHANAINGIHVALSSNGSGTQRLLRGLPWIRWRTYAKRSEIISADLNSMQDEIIRLYSDIRSDLIISGMAGMPYDVQGGVGGTSGSSPNPVLALANFNNAGALETLGAAILRYPIPTNVGRVPKSFSVCMKGNATANATFRVWKHHPSDGAALVLSVDHIAVSATAALYTHALGTVQDGAALCLDVIASAAAIAVYQVRVSY